ncbi:MAG: hypothetical protein Q8907_16455 [Bacteroidota bacterium]|nr:hypothetical protein [Bacteroidota bacterium]
MELARNLGFKNVKRLSSKQKEFVDALNEVELHRKGKIKLQ